MSKPQGGQSGERSHADPSRRSRVSPTSRLGRQADVQKESAILSELVTASEFAFGWADLEGNVVYLNPAACRLLDVPSPEDAIGTNFRSFYAAGPLQELDAQVLPTVLREGKWIGELPLRSAQGRTIQAIQNIFLIHGQKETERYIANVITDITDRQQTEEALRRSEAEKTLILNSTSELIIYRDSEYAVRWANESAAASVGKRPEELVGRKCYEIWRARQIPCDQCPLADVAEGHSIESELVGSDGRTWLIHGTPVRGENDETLGFIKVMTDITERKKAEQRLHLLSSAVEQSSEGIAVADLEGHLLFVNRAFATMHGYEPEQVLGKHLSVFHTPEQMRVVDEANRTAQETGEFHGEVWHARRDGSVFPALMQKSLLRDEAGTPIGMIGTLQDVTQQRRAEELTRQREAELAHASRLSMMGEMASGIVHEVNQPLSAIANGAHACLRLLTAEGEGADPKQFAGKLHVIAEQAERAAQIVRRLRGFVAKWEPKWSNFDVCAAIRETAAFIVAQAREGGVEVQLDLPGCLPPVRGDMVQIEQVILNLARNSLDAMEEEQGGARHLTFRASALDGEVVEVAVEDTGPGLTPDAAQKAFEPFFSTKKMGMGIGLSISRSIIEAHHGCLWFTPNPERGATFRFTLKSAP
ncbi:MAG TPA: PAS domain S-box protein [Phycisphaerae bacterium]|nr:PAS domain S-box protein [Phycisphaerae bacterium]